MLIDPSWDRFALDALLLALAAAAVLAFRWIPLQRDRRTAEVALRGARARAETALAERERLAAEAAQDREAIRAGLTFLARTAEALRVPATAIDAGIGLALRPPLADGGRARLSALRALSEDLLTGLDAALDHARLEAGALELERTEFDPGQLLDEVALALAPREAERAVRWEVQAPPERATTLVGDPRRWKQVLVQLARHALASTTDARPVLTVEEIACAGAQVQLHAWIETGGPGFDAEGFAGGGATGATPTDRAALDRAIVRALVARMEGRLWAETKDGRARVHVAARFGLGGPRPTRPPLAEPALADLRGTTVLLVDADALHRETAAALLTSEGLQVLGAGSGEDALETLRARPEAACVLVDGRLPGIDGAETIRRLRAEPALRDLPVLALVPRDLPEAFPAALAASVDGWLDTPLAPGAALRAIAERLGGARSQARSSPPAPGPIDRAAGIAACDGDVERWAASAARFRALHAATDARLRAATHADPFAARVLAERLALDARQVGARSTAVAAARLVAQLDRGAAAAELGGELDALDAALSRDLTALHGSDA